ncbi:DUF5996 family protein [Lewinella sp. JB7]|uniref:DUF5996 family protein n=1 Tax=Lewinella sp. JB7 TaxID=2962887 RepID=UPI0020C93CA2|nr:DUF5996 family protein [Lewinella sp. JB7]MCP9234701.1 DUF5996 family protein [Lewinella sp. JB7]
MKISPLPLPPWEPAKRTLHHFLQIIGKVRKARMPVRNHWWNLTLYVDPRGVSTRGMPLDDIGNQFEIRLDLIGHRCEVVTSRGEEVGFPLARGLSVADFYRQVNGLLAKIDAATPILARPYDLETDRPFAELTDVADYEPEAVSKFWRALLWVDGVLKEFAGRFYGKTCPAHLYWHHFDLVITRFSGKLAPPMPPSASAVERDAYSHEVISFGFWPGDDKVREAAFYSYTYPLPEGIADEPLLPAGADWVDSNGSPLAFLPWAVLVGAPNPRQDLLDFLESTYTAGARRAGWELEEWRYESFEA